MSKEPEATGPFTATDRSSGLPALRGRPLWAIALILVPMACGDSAEQSLCPVYADLLDARVAIESVDPTSKSASDATGIVEDYLDSVKRLREVDSVYTAQIDDLEVAVADVLRTLESVEDDADYSTWAPLIEDSLEDVTTSADRVEDLIEPQCVPNLDE